NERCKRTCVLVAAVAHQPGEERGVDRKEGAEGDQEPCPPLHAPRLAAPIRCASRGTRGPVRDQLQPRLAQRTGSHPSATLSPPEAVASGSVGALGVSHTLERPFV